jgi:anaerobic ribonucleoside-triphosphate reductase
MEILSDRQKLELKFRERIYLHGLTCGGKLTLNGRYKDVPRYRCRSKNCGFTTNERPITNLIGENKMTWQEVEARRKNVI